MQLLWMDKGLNPINLYELRLKVEVLEIQTKQKSLLQELCIPSATPLLWCDNQSATHLSANLVFQSISKHIELDLHFIRDNVQKELNIDYLPSCDQLADIFTKHLPSSQFLTFWDKLLVTS
ncbi:Retrovirus-related Pol polyprotein from transposon RE1 [Vitis vinifera]|uniref:Retrovirus-related Pol polyprotein from transposon RE1 n=1 Tax=Vitis vinifera TaxID=29760 RepID=A0A438CDF8_VITVI|nr:Retrovirus-related Pol polyprotein from transposon RE1 [Vitis vinifera]